MFLLDCVDQKMLQTILCPATKISLAELSTVENRKKKKT